MKIKATQTQCLEFLSEMVEEALDAAVYYGVSMNTPEEEQAADDYCKAWTKVQVAMQLTYKAPSKTEKADGT